MLIGLLKALAFALVAGAVCAVGGYVFSKKLLCVEMPTERAEVIVVLGGETDARAQQALKLYRQGIAPAIIVTGTGDAATMRQDLLDGGVPASAIEVEDRSKNTKENAEFTARLLERRHIATAVLVTSWYHSRRALNSFRFFAPGVRFYSAPTFAGQSAPSETVHIFWEYIKTAGYFVRYGIPPVSAAKS